MHLAVRSEREETAKSCVSTSEGTNQKKYMVWKCICTNYRATRSDHFVWVSEVICPRTVNAIVTNATAQRHPRINRINHFVNCGVVECALSAVATCHSHFCWMNFLPVHLSVSLQFVCMCFVCSLSMWLKLFKRRKKNTHTPTHSMKFKPVSCTQWFLVWFLQDINEFEVVKTTEEKRATVQTKKSGKKSKTHTKQICR